MIPAIREARRRSRSTTPTSAVGFCKREVRECLSMNLGHEIASRSETAADCWENAKLKHRTDDPTAIPRGAAAFWLGGSEGAGHVTLPIGNAGHWTTDLLRPGFFDRTGIRLVSLRWTSLRLVGWTEDFDGERIWRDGNPIVVDRAARRFVELPAAVHEVPDDEPAFVARHDLLSDQVEEFPRLVAAREWLAGRA